jgi:DNA-binding CsgD family transcriptional regulator
MPTAPDTISRCLSALVHSRDRGAATLAFQDAVGTLGFDGFCLGSSAPQNDNWVLAPVLTNWPEPAMLEYARRGFQQIDPTLKHLRRYHTPFVWDARTPTSAESKPLFDFLLTTSVKSGIVVPLGLGNDRLWVLSASRSTFEPFDPDVTRLLTLYGHAAKAIFEGLDEHHSLGAANTPALTSQQLQILRWAAEGKSSGDIAVIAGFSKRTVEYHFSEILRKLNVATRAQAIAQLPLLSGSSWYWSDSIEDR